MSVYCEKVPKSQIVDKTHFAGVTEHIFVGRTERPKDIDVATKWSMDPCFMPYPFGNVAERIVNLSIRPDDVWIVTFPKCGTTWAQEMIWLICNNLDYEASAKAKLVERFPFLEITHILSEDWREYDSIEVVEKCNSPRFIKSHLPAPLLPNQLWTVKPKIVYVARNAKDAAVSFFHHHSNIHYYKETMEDFLETFENDKIMYAPYHSHINDFWRMRNEDNVFFLTYEDMKKDLPAVIRSLVTFYGKTYSDDQVQVLADHLSFSKFTKNPSVNLEGILRDIEKAVNMKMNDQNYKFVRRGDTGAFRDEMSPEISERFDKWTEREMKRLNCDPELRKIFLLAEKPDSTKE